MTTDEKLLAAEKHAFRQDLIIQVLIDVLRPFAMVADLQEHTDCMGLLKQEDWERAAELVASDNQDREDTMNRNAKLLHAH